MEIVITKNLKESLLSYVTNNFPYCDVGVVGDFEYVRRALERAGNRVIDCYKEVPPSVRVIIASGEEEAVLEAKKSGLPYVVAGQKVNLVTFQNFGIYDFQKVEYGYPNIVFLDNTNDEYLFQAEVEILLTALYVESLSIFGSGRLGEKERVAYNLLKEFVEIEGEFRTDEELLKFLSTGIEALGGLEYVSFLFETLNRLHPLDNIHARFYALFSLLYLKRQFTNYDFCAILPCVDLVRARIIAELNGIKLPLERGRPPQVNFLLEQVKDFIPTENELEKLLNSFRLSAGDVKVDLDAIITAIIISAILLPKKHLVRDLVESGYLDALTFNTKEKYESNR